MTYADFSFQLLQERPGLRFTARHLFAEAVPIEPSTWLRETLRIGWQAGFTGGKSRDERFVSPILLEIAIRNEGVFSVQSGVWLEADAAQGLAGDVDFVFDIGRIQEFVTAPFCCVTQAASMGEDDGAAQCAAQLLGAWSFNQQRRNVCPNLYGIATTGTVWRLLHFNGNTLTLDQARYHITELPRLLGALQAIVDHTTPATVAD